jgi:glutamine cyclotransferase
MSDGSATLFFLDPETYAVLSTIEVLDEGAPVTMLNELEYVRGEIFANIWQTDTIVRIDPQTGAVKGWIDLSGLLPEEERTPATNVLNGIAYDPATDRLFVTGKLWPKLYEIRLVSIGAGD